MQRRKLQYSIILSILAILALGISSLGNVRAGGGDVTAPNFNFTNSHSGTLTTPGTYTYDFSVTDSANNIAMIDYTIDETVPRLARKIYIDNVVIGTNNPGDVLNATSNNLTIGQTNYGTESFEGLIDEVRVYNRYLNTYEIAQLFDYPDNPSDPTPTNGLVGYWDMDEASYDGTTGEVVDSSGSGMNGTAQGNATTAAGRLGNALMVDGIGDSVQIANGSALPIGNSFYTVSAWINPTYMGSRGIIGWGDYGDDFEVNAFRLTSGGILNYWWGSDYAIDAPGNDLTGAWHHIVVTYGYDREAIVPTDGVFDELSESASLTINSADFNDGEPHTVKFYVTDTEGNQRSQSYTFTIGNDVTAPVFDFSTASAGSVTGPNAVYEFNVTDAASNLSSVEFEVNNEGRAGLTADDGTIDEASEDFSLTIARTGFVMNEDYTVHFYAKDSEDNEITEDFVFSFYQDEVAPTITFDESPDGLTGVEFTISGTAIDSETNIESVSYRIDNRDPVIIAAFDNDYNSQSEAFEVLLKASSNYQDIADGSHTIQVIVIDELNNERIYNFSIIMDRTSPTCIFVNKPTPHYSNTGTYSNITCTDNNQIASAEYWVYHSILGTLISGTPVPAADGVFNEATEEFTFTFTLDPDEDWDGPVSIGFSAYDQVGNRNPDHDPLVIEYIDDSNPVIKLDRVTPDPITDTTPKITGSCTDNTQYDTNSFINLIEYQINSNGWVNVVPSEAPYNDSYSEIFSVELPEQSIGAYTITIRCTDATGHISTDNDTFNIIAIDEDAVAGNFEHTDTFLSHNFQDVPNTTLIWGNDRLRLKEDITFSRTAIDTTGFGGRYDEIRSAFTVIEDPQDANILWYTKSNTIHKYNIQSNTTEAFDMNNAFGFASFQEIHSLHITMYLNKKYMWISDAYNLNVYNMTDNQFVQVAVDEGAYSVDPDTSRGRLAAYLITGNAPSGYTNIIYYDFSNTLTNTSDDALFRHAIDADFDANNASTVWRDKSSNDVYVTYSVGGKIHKYNDSNTPANITDDSDVLTYSGINGVAGFTLDPEGRLIYGTANNSNGEVFVVTDDGGTEFDPGDDTITKIANNRQLGFRNIFGIKYIEGENNVGDQLIFTTENNDPIYMNFNNTYTDLLDDTFIDLPFRGGSRPGSVFSYVLNYDTLLVNINTQGLYKIDLHRGWVDSGEAIGVPVRPSQKLILDNFIADAEQIGNIVAGAVGQPGLLDQLQNIFIPKVSAQENGIVYYISNDDGLTWHEITLGQLQQLNPNDYRVKFKIEMTEQGGQSPALDQYTLAFAAYTTEEQALEVTNLGALASPSSVRVNNNFTLTLKALDSLGFSIPEFNSNLTLALVDTSNNLVIDTLNKSNATLVNGVITLTDVQINKTGQYKVRVTDGSHTTYSNVITVSPNTITTPSLVFYANTYKIKKGEDVTLFWDSEYLSNLTITPTIGSVSVDGSRLINLEQTTYFTIQGSGQYGSLSAGFEVIVEDSATNAVGNANQLLTLETSKEITINEGQKVTITWTSTGADFVYIDYLGKTVSSSGEFEFYPSDNITVTITATQGNETITKTINIKVNKLPLNIGAVIDPKSISDLNKLPLYNLIALAILYITTFGAILLNILASGPANITFNTITNILRILGIIPYKKREGYVYQTKTAKPVALAVMNLMNSENKILASIVTDLDGSYYEPFLAKGNYRIDVNHAEHKFPTDDERPNYMSLFDYYKGEDIVVKSNKNKQAVIVPMDYQKNKNLQTWDLKKKLALLLKRLLVWLQWTVYPMFALSLIYLTIDSNVINIIVASIYTIIVGWKLFIILKRPTLTGKVKDQKTGEPLANAIILLKTMKGDIAGVEKTNKNGEYKFFVPQDKYNIFANIEGYITNQGFGTIEVLDLRLTGNLKYDINLIKAE